MRLLLTKYSHHFTVTRIEPPAEQILIGYSRALTSYQTTRKINGDVISTPHKTFADRNNHPRTYRFHIEQFDAFCKYLDDFGQSYDVDVKGMYTPLKETFKLNKAFKPRDYQEPIIDFICSEGYKRVITLQTGLGKTAVLLFAIARMGVRTVLVISPKYFERWLDDLSISQGADPMLPLKDGTELLTVRGSAEMRSLILLAQCEELEAKVILISAATYFQYLVHFKNFGLDDKYANLNPTDLWETLGVGMVGVDEGHENFHALFRADLYTHVPLTVTLSATLVPDDPFLKHMYQILYPERLRMDGGNYIRYADMLSVPYSQLPDKPLLKTSWKGRRDYSQLAFEQDLLEDKNHKRFDAMLDMIKYDIDSYFLKQRYKKFKLLIFFDTVEMCVRVSERLADLYPDMIVGKYTAEEKYEVLKELEIIVATTKSADTGVDIPNLQMVFCFVARGSTQANLQMFGRLRRLKTDEVRPVFLYYRCLDIPQHNTYHEKRKEIFGGKTLSMNDRKTHFVI